MKFYQYQNVKELLVEIFQSQKVTDENGLSYELHSHTGIDQGLLLQRIIKEIKPKKSLEIGLAYGISSLFILEALEEIRGNKCIHYIFDPSPDIYWNNIGLHNIKKAKYEHLVSFHKVLSEDGLIDLITRKERIQFAYIDSTKVFDVLLVDFYLINKLLDVGGVIIFDDCGFPGIRKLVRYISKLPFYEIYATYHQDKETLKKSNIKAFASFILRNMPFSKKVFPGLNFTTDQKNRINFHCIAFRKKAEDNRSWDWSIDF
ncbi:MAG: class I SAM-dependent methyltransferase [Flavobacterium sp.]|nr:MAG: class I SAM-dependent methyltransferase [Flavobacterium sp.]